MSALIGFLESVKPQFVIQPFELVKNKAGNLVVRSASIHYQNLPIVKRFGENEKLNARRRCDRGGMIGKSWTRCHYKINVNGKDAWVSEKYIGGQEEVALHQSKIAARLAEDNLTQGTLYGNMRSDEWWKKKRGRK